MSGSSGTPQTVQTQTQTKDPWSGAQPYLTEAMGSAQSLYRGDYGYHPYEGTSQMPLDPSFETALGAQANLATQNLKGAPSILAGQSLAQQMIENQGMNSGIQSQIGGLQRLATEAQGQQNPYLQSILDTQGRQISDRVNSTMSGAGRYGSGAHNDVMARALAESANPLLAQDYEQRQQRQQQLYGQMADLYGGGLQRAGQWAQLAPTLQEASYLPSERLAAVGQFRSSRAQDYMNDYLKRYAENQARPWEQLSRYNAIVGGAGGLGGSSVTSIQQPQASGLQRILGGSLAGAGVGSMFGPVGAGAGALGGGLLGML